MLKSDIYTVMGFNYSSLKNDVKALELYRKALKLIERTKDLRRRADLLTNIRIIHYEAGRMDSLKYYARQSLDIYRLSAKQNKEDLYEIGGLGRALLDLDSVEPAIRYFRKGLDWLPPEKKSIP